MTFKNFAITIIATLLFISCSNSPKQENSSTTTKDEIVLISSTNKTGKTLDISFNNTKGTATLSYDGDTIELIAQKSASGFWYKNDQYELRGKANDIVLKKNDTVVFEHQDDIVTSSLTNDEGNTLDIIFNNTTNTAKAYLNGGEQIDLVGEKPASGIWYTNEHYELRGKGEKLELIKDGTIVFKN